MSLSRIGLYSSLLLCLICTTALAKKIPPTTPPKATPQPPAPALILVPHPPRYFFSVNLDPRYQLVGLGLITEDQARRANHYRFTYNTDGTLSRVEYFRTAGNPQADPTFSVPRIDISTQDDPSTHSREELRSYMDSNGHVIRDGDGVAVEELHLNASGGVIEIFNKNERLQPTADGEGVFHYIRKLDAKNRVISLSRFAMGNLLQPGEHQITDQYGYYETRTVYDDQDRPVERTNYDASGARLKNGDGIATTRTVYTLFPDFTKIQESYFAPDGVAVRDPKGVHMRIYLHDKRDFEISESYFDDRGAPCFDNEVLSGEVPLAAYDYLHLYDLPNEDDHIHGKRFTFDDFGNLVKIQYVGLDEQPKEVKSTGYAEIRNTFDDQNRLVEQGFYGDDGNPVLSRQLGVAFVKEAYGLDGNLESCEYFDAQHNPINHQGYGVPAIKIKVVGDKTFIFLRDGQGKPAPNPAASYYSLSYVTAYDQPLSKHNTYYDASGQRLTRLNMYLNRFLHALKGEYYIQLSARLGALSLAIGALLAAFTSIRKTFATITRRSFIPSPFPRFLSITAYYLIGEGILRMVASVYWYLNTANHIEVHFYRIYTLEAGLLIYFGMRYLRLMNSLRIYNIAQDALTDLIKKFFADANVPFEQRSKPLRFSSIPLTISINYFRTKRHASLKLHAKNADGIKLRKNFVTFIKSQIKTLKSPSRRILFLVYYPLQTITYISICLAALLVLDLLMQG